MPATQSDFVLQASSGVVGTWVQLVNNVTAATIVAQAATNSAGRFTVLNVPAGIYTLSTGPTSIGPFTAIDTNYVVAPNPLFVDITDFGGKADGSTDNSTALTNAVAALPTTGGTIFFPAAALSYNFASLINLASKNFIRLMGAGPASSGGAATSSLLRFTTTTGPLISAASSTGLELEDLYIQWPAAFAGTVVDFSGTTLNKIKGCQFGANGGGHAAALIVGLDNAILCAIERSEFHNATVGIQGIGTGGHFSNAVQIQTCTFSSSTGDIATAHVQNPGQGWLIQGNDFEMGTTAGTPNAIGSPLGGSLGVTVIGNWFGDAGAGVLTFIDINGDGWSVIGNIMGSNSNASSVLINQRSGANGLTVMGNRMQNAGTGVLFVGSAVDCVVLGNRFNGVTSRTSGVPSSGVMQSGTGSGGLRVLGDLERSSQTPTETVLVSGVDPTLGEHISVTLTAARLVGAPLNPATGQHLYFTLTQGGVGAFAVTWNAVFKVTWSDAGNATGKISTIGFWYNGTNWIQLGGQAPYV